MGLGRVDAEAYDYKYPPRCVQAFRDDQRNNWHRVVKTLDK